MGFPVKFPKKTNPLMFETNFQAWLVTPRPRREPNCWAKASDDWQAPFPCYGEAIVPSVSLRAVENHFKTIFH